MSPFFFVWSKVNNKLCTWLWQVVISTITVSCSPKNSNTNYCTVEYQHSFGLAHWQKNFSSTVQPDSHRLESGTDTYILASFDTLRYTQLHPANCSSPFVLSPPNLLQPLQHSFIFSIVIGCKEVSWIHVVAVVIRCLFSCSPATHRACIRW